VPIPGFYVWKAPGKRISIQLSLDVVDRLQQDVMRGFGAVPRRGAEVGGILIGAVEGAAPVVRIEDYQLVPIEYKRGPTFRLSEEDLQAFEAALHQPRDGKALRPIGYFRSHTRDSVGLCDEDRELLSKYFPEPQSIVLLIRPFGTKPSVAGFYFKEEGVFQSGAALLEFPFRRKDLAPGEASAPPARRTRPRIDSVAAPDIVRTGPVGRKPVEPSLPATIPSGRKWLPLAAILLLMGVLLGYQAALTIRPHPPAGNSDPYRLSLTVTQSGSVLQLKWDRQSLAIRTAQRGVLTIEDGSFHNTTNLTSAELQSGSTIPYHPLTNYVRFRLEVFLNPRSKLSETVEWKK
jgi:hypothetical protein